MTKNPEETIWQLRLQYSQADASNIQVIEDWIDNIPDVAAVTMLSPPRQKIVSFEIILTKKPNISYINSSLAELASHNTLEMPALSCEQIPPTNWLRKVNADFPPVKVGMWLCGSPAWRSSMGRHRLTLEIESWGAFGTGEHPTTRGCLVEIAKIIKRRNMWVRRAHRMLEMGCGTAVLALAVVRALPWVRAVAVDCDPQAVRLAIANVVMNRLRNLIVKRSHGYASQSVINNAPYDLIAANILLRPLCNMAPMLARNLRSGGYAVLSGILDNQVAAVIASHRRCGLVLVSVSEYEEWRVVVMRKPINVIKLR